MGNEAKLSMSEAIQQTALKQKQDAYMSQFNSDPSAYTAPLASEDADAWAMQQGLINPQTKDVDRTSSDYKEFRLKQMETLQRQISGNPNFIPQFLTKDKVEEYKDALNSDDEGAKVGVVNSLAAEYEPRRFGYVLNQLGLPSFTAKVVSKFGPGYPKMLSTMLAAAGHKDQSKASMFFTGNTDAEVESEKREDIRKLFRDSEIISSLFDIESRQTGNRLGLKQTEELFVTVARTLGEDGAKQLVEMVESQYEVVEHAPSWVQRGSESMFSFGAKDKGIVTATAEAGIQAGQQAYRAFTGVYDSALSVLGLDEYRTEAASSRIRLLLDKHDPDIEKWKKVLPVGFMGDLEADNNYWKRITAGATAPKVSKDSMIATAMDSSNAEWLRMRGIKSVFKQGDKYVVLDMRTGNPNSFTGGQGKTARQVLKESELEALLSERDTQFTEDIYNNTQLVGGNGGYHLVRRGKGVFDGGEVVASFNSGLVDELLKTDEENIHQSVVNFFTDFGTAFAKNMEKTSKDAMALGDTAASGFGTAYDGIVPDEMHNSVRNLIYQIWKEL